jgi:aryl-alcohol dehydrogenase-like predicted oxidoreductase
VSLTRRQIGPFEVSALGFGCMSLSHAYNPPVPREQAERVLNAVLDGGCDFLDTAALYGFGHNETTVGDCVSHRRKEFTLASKCGMTGVDGVRVIDGRPETIKATCEASLQRLKTDVIDLYYLHRWDKKVPIEDSVGALADLVAAGKIRTIGLSEVSAETLRKAHAVHPVAAVQSEYSLWTRNPEVAVLDACRELGVAFVAFGALARGFLSGKLGEHHHFEAKDIRSGMPRFQGDNWRKNHVLLRMFEEVALEIGCTPAQLALAWTLNRAPHIVPIPGTRSVDHFHENMGALGLALTPEAMATLDALINPKTVAGPRYNAATQVEIDTEELPEDWVA